MSYSCPYAPFSKIGTHCLTHRGGDTSGAVHRKMKYHTYSGTLYCNVIQSAQLNSTTTVQPLATVLGEDRTISVRYCMHPVNYRPHIYDMPYAKEHATPMNAEDTPSYSTDSNLPLPVQPLKKPRNKSCVANVVGVTLSSLASDLARLVPDCTAVRAAMASPDNASGSPRRV